MTKSNSKQNDIVLSLGEFLRDNLVNLYSRRLDARLVSQLSQIPSHSIRMNWFYPEMVTMMIQ